MNEDLNPEDVKIITLARGARLRAYAPHRGPGEGAAVRDIEGRTYAAATVEHPDLALSTSALQGALAAGYSSGARSFEACAVVGDPARLTHRDAALLAALAVGVPVLLTGPDGVVVGVTTVDSDGQQSTPK